MKPSRPFVFVVVLVTLTSCSQIAPRRAGIEIAVPANARDASHPGGVSLKVPPGQPNYNGSPRRFSAAESVRGLPSLFPGREMRRITVIRFLPGWDAQTPYSVRTKLVELMRRRLDAPMGQIGWDEYNIWTIEASIEFSDGPGVRILTDGGHICLIDDQGEPWFFRMLRD
jgi:hypothetical protein